MSLSQVRELRQQVSAYQQEISQSELVHSDWEMEKEALESVLVKLRGDLKAKEEQLTVLQAQRVSNSRIGRVACSRILFESMKTLACFFLQG